jgi:4-diphosphocytidyl-2-C-methyl-D-erythritol kinase
MAVRSVVARAHAKINLTLRVGAVRSDGYHEVQTVLQALALHDVVRCVPRPGPFAIECGIAAIPTDHTNLVWRAADVLWRRLGRAGGPRDVVVRLTKRIPVQAGMGGGSSDGVAALRALARLWRVVLTPDDLVRLSAALGADAPFFVTGGTAVGLVRGDDVYPLSDLPRLAILVAMPRFGVSTADAYRWVDQDRGTTLPTPLSPPPTPQLVPTRWPGGGIAVTNDFESAVTRRHPEIAALTREIRRQGALAAAMAGSGAAVFGVFDQARRARLAASALAPLHVRVLVTETMRRSDYARSVRPSTVRTGR